MVEFMEIDGGYGYVELGTGCEDSIKVDIMEKDGDNTIVWCMNSIFKPSALSKLLAGSMRLEHS